MDFNLGKHLRQKTNASSAKMTRSSRMAADGMCDKRESKHLSLQPSCTQPTVRHC